MSATADGHKPERTPRSRTARTARIIGWTVVSVVAYFVLLPLLSAIDGPDGKPWIETSILGEQIKQLGLIASVSGPAAITLLKDVKDVKHEVKNDHSTNLRVENDSRHGEMLKLLNDVRQDIGGIRQELRDDRRSVSDRFDAVHDRLSEHSERINKKAPEDVGYRHAFHRGS